MKSVFALLALLLSTFGHVLAWGPHPEITQAAVDTLSPDDPLLTKLGPEAKHLREYCWMADWRRTLHKEGSQWFYTDDYLLFPPMPMHSDHLCPEVKQTYEPFFRRALQALRTETSTNAARWIGSITHFTEDTGSPPHAAEIRGPVHSKMENWVDAKAITIAGYRPQLLGRTDDEAVAGFLGRMDGLIQFSKLRAERAKPFVLGNDRSSTEAIVLESALEVSRVVADLLHTLGALAGQLPDKGTTLTGSISSAPPPGLENVPAKVMILGTLYSTLADASGHYEFKELPAATYRVAVLRAGNQVQTTTVAVSDGIPCQQDFKLSADAVPGNMVRDATLNLHWLAPDRPDNWYPVKPKLVKPHWEGELLPLQPGKTYRLSIDWQKNATGRVSVQLLTSAVFTKPAIELKPLSPGEAELTFMATSETAYAQIILHSDASPSSSFAHVALSLMP